MVGSMDFLDFSIELPDAVPLHCWQDISLSNIWIPSRLLPTRNKACNTGGPQGIYHRLEKKDSSKFIGSFSVYIDSGNEQEIFLSDSDEDIFGDYTSFDNFEKLTNDMLKITADISVPFTNSSNNNETNYLKTENFDAKSRSKDEANLYSGKNLSFQSLKNSGNEINVNETCGYDEQKNAKILHSEEKPENSKRGMDEKNNVFEHNITTNITPSHGNLALVKEYHDGETKYFKDMQLMKKENKDSDSHISLNEIVNATPEISLKDFTFKLKKNDDSDILSIGNGQKTTKNRDKKGKKKAQKYVPLDMLFEDSSTSQDYYCEKYIQKLLQEEGRSNQTGKTPLRCNREFPDLVSESEEVMFIHSDKTAKEDNIEFNTSSFVQSDQAVEEEYVESSECLNNLNKFDATEIENAEEMQTVKNGKIIIENIPHDACEDDIKSILCGYGEIKNFSMISSGKSLEASVEIDLICDIDWVIECLNGSEPFGEGSGVLKCYEQL